MKLILAFTLSVCATSAATAAPVPPADQAAIRAFLNKLYASYKNEKVRADTLSARGSSSLFTPSTDRLRAENDRLANGENWGLDFDIFCGCQDYDTSLKLTAATFTPLPKGRIHARVQVYNYGFKTINIQFEKTPAGWRVYDVELPQLGMLRAVLAKENAELSKGAGLAAPPAPAVPTQPPFPERIEYQGFTGSEQFPVFNNFKVTASGGTLGGSAFMQIGIFSGDAPITGTYANGECVITRKKQTYRGRCDAREFSGTIYSASGKPGERFRFLSMAEWARLQAGGAAVPSSAAPPPATAAYNDVEPAAAVLVPSYGRSRLLIEPGGRCSPAGQLAKGYCFDLATGYLERHRGLNQVTVVTMTRSYLLGTWVPYNSGQGWNLYEVKRRGDTFTADRDRQFSTKVSPPQGCVPGITQDEGWYVTTADGYKVAAEAKQFLCDPARSSAVLIRGAKPLPRGDGARAAGGFASRPQAASGGFGSAPQVAPRAPLAGSSTAAFDQDGRQNPMRQDDSGLIYGTPDEAPARVKSKAKRKR